MTVSSGSGGGKTIPKNLLGQMNVLNVVVKVKGKG
jgi:hypothetical protein